MSQFDESQIFSEEESRQESIFTEKEAETPPAADEKIDLDF